MKSRHHVITKIARPSAAGILPRPRLFKRLDQCRKQPAVWLSGPGGAGKTTLLAGYLDARRLPCLWYQLDAGDDDPATFFYYLGLAVGKAAPRHKKPLPLLTPEYLPGLSLFARRYFEQVFNRLDSPSAIVFDNYQDLPEESAIHGVLEAVLAMITAGISVIVLSRTDPPANLARLRAAEQLCLLGWDELRFTDEESGNLVKTRTNAKTDAKTLALLSARADGWAAGLVLLSERLRTGDQDFETLGSMSREGIFDYFAAEIFEKAGNGVQQFLLETSFLPMLNPEHAEALTNNPRAGRILSDLHRKNYFTQLHRGRGREYQYHPLFREFLLARCRESYGPGRFQEIGKKAGSVLAAAGQQENAVDLFLNAAEWTDACPLILEQAPVLVSQGRGRALTDWIRRLPEAVREENPFLIYWHGVTRIAVDPLESRLLMERSFRLFRAQRDAAGLYLSFSGVIDAITYGNITIGGFDHWLELFDRLRSDYPRFPSEDIEARVAKSLLNVFFLARPDYPGVEAWLERAHTLTKRINDLDLKTQIFSASAICELMTGDLARAARCLEEYRGLMRTPGVSPLALIVLKNAEALYYEVTADFKKCHAAVDEGLALAAEYGMHFFDINIIAHGTAAALSSGDREKAGKWLSEMARTTSVQKTWEKSFYHTLKTWNALLLGETSEAHLHAELALNLVLEVGTPHPVAMHTIGMALACHAVKKDQEARQHLGKVRNMARAITMRQVEFRCMLAEAQLAYDGGNDAEGTELLRDAMTLGKAGGYMNTIFWIPSVMAGLCVKALEEDIEPDYVRELVRKRGLVPDTPPLQCEQWPWPVQIRTLGRVELARDNKPVRFSRKVPKKSLDLLKALIAFNGEVSETRLCDVLWPDADGDAAQRAFKITLLRLRDLLELKEAIQHRDGTVSLDRRFVWVDTWAFEAAVEAYSDDKSGAALEKIFSLYQGPFLNDVRENWAMSLRERLRRKFLGLIEKAGSRWEEQKKYRPATDCYLKGLETDDLFEEFYQRIIACYLHLGRKAEALSVYKRCEKTLQAYHMEPSSETKALYNRLIS